MANPFTGLFGKTRRRAPRKPRLELLEDRLTPATIPVTTFADVVNPFDHKVSLREAITAANKTADPDTILLQAGTYRITILPEAANQNPNATGSFDILARTTLVGAGAGRTVINAGHADRVFSVTGTAPGSIGVLFQGLTVTGGETDGDGGGILFGNANLTLRDCVVASNIGGNGGGVSNAAAPGTGNLTLIRTTVSENLASGEGGGVYLWGNSQGRGSTLRVFGSSLRRNAADDGGGGISASTAILTNSTVAGNTLEPAGASGGGIRAGKVVLTNCAVSHNVASGNGGGLRADTVILKGSTVSGNASFNNGGGIHAGTATVTLSTVSGNTSSFNGGGISASTLTLIHSSVSGHNKAGNNGGGITAFVANLVNSTVGGNTSGGYGGGVYATSTTVLNSTVSGNRSGYSGGGINAGTATLKNSTVTGNRAEGDGGGVYAFTLALFSDTIARNVAANGGGVFHYGTDPADVKNTIIALNLIKSGGVGPDVNGAFTSGGHNLIGIFDGSTGWDLLKGDVVGTAAAPIDPRLGPLANNGGPTRTLALLPGSKAIDHGDNSGAPGADQRGVTRRRDGDGNGSHITDIGAFEL